MPQSSLDRYRAVIDDWDRFEAACARPLPYAFRTNTLRIAPAQLQERLEQQGISASSVAWSSEGFELDRPPGGLLEHWLGLFYVQETVQWLPPMVLDPQPGERVLDLCAAPGGKCTHIAARMGNSGCLIANEPNGRRQMSLLANLNRLGILIATVTAYQGENFPCSETFDRVLVDAPCSAEGTLRKESSMRGGASPSAIKRLAKLQRRLILRAFDVLAPDGVLVYSTCTFAPEENESVVSFLLAERDAQLQPVSLPFAAASGLPSWEDEDFPAEIEKCVRVYPHHINSGGGFLARIVRA